MLKTKEVEILFVPLAVLDKTAVGKWDADDSFPVWKAELVYELLTTTDFVELDELEGSALYMVV